MIPFLYTTHGKKKKAFGGSGSSTTTTARPSSAVSGKAMSSTTSSSSLSAISTTASSSSGSSGGNPVFKRSKSVAHRPTGGYPDGCRAGGAITEDPEKFDSPRKKSFWSFLYLSSSQQNSHHHSSSPRSKTIAAKRRGALGGGGSKDANGSSNVTAPATTYIRDIKLLPQPPQLPAISTALAASATASRSSSKPQEDAKTPRREYPASVAPAGGPAATTAVRAEEADDSPGSGSQASASFGRKVARSRSVGCGSRSFSGDFLERISAVGFGDCTLRRVESQREAKPGKVASHHHRRAAGEEDQELPPQRVVRCGGIFGGFYSSSSSSSYWLSDDLGGGNSGAGTGRISTAVPGDGGGDSGTPHSRRGWAWAAFASPIRAFRQSSSSNKHASAVASVNGINPATGRSAVSSSTTTLPAPNTAGGGAALVAAKG